MMFKLTSGLVIVLLIVVGCGNDPKDIKLPKYEDLVEAPIVDHTGLFTGNNFGLGQGQIPPDFNITSIEGELVNIREYSNARPVLIYFMATWCPYCRTDFDTLKDIYPEYSDDVVVVVQSLDLKEKADKLRDYKSEFAGIEKAIFAEGKESVLRDYNVRFTTTKYAISREGKVLYAGSGAFSVDQWKTLLEALKNS